MSFKYNWENITLSFIESVYSRFEKILNEIKFTNDKMLLFELLTSYEDDTDIFVIRACHLFHPNREIREASLDYNNKLDSLEYETIKTTHVYNLLNELNNNSHNEQMNKYLTKTIKLLEREGLHLEGERKEELISINKEINELCNLFVKNVNNYTHTFVFQSSDLTGVSSSFINKNKKEDNTVVFDLSFPQIMPILITCSNRNVRQEVYTQLKHKGGLENIELSKKIFLLRNRKAKLLDFNSYSEFKLTYNFAQNKDTTFEFIEKLSDLLSPHVLSNISELKKVINNDNFEIGPWDLLYLQDLYKKTYTNFNAQDYLKYFPVNDVITKTFEIYSNLLNLSIIKRFCKTWDDSVSTYDVFDNDCESNENNINYLGTIYLDLYPREGKIGNACCLLLLDKSINHPNVNIMLCNFSNDNMRFDEFQTFFHEFGHSMHQICNRNMYSTLGSFQCEPDFIEVPSQMFEQFVYNSDVIDWIPKDVIDIFNKSRKNLSALTEAKTLGFSLFDLKAHGEIDVNMNFDKMCQDCLTQTMMYDNYQNGTIHDLWAFTHLFSGYESSYYGYQFSKVYSLNIYKKITENKENIKKLCILFKQEVLNKGSAYKSRELINNFIGSEFNIEYFNDLFV